MKTTAQRMYELRERRKAEGMSEVRIWALPEHHAALKKLAAKLGKQPKGK